MKAPVPWTTDTNGQLRGVAVHDGSLLDFHASTDRQSYVIKAQSSEIVEVELIGVLDFNVVKFWQGAIVSEIFAWKLDEVPAQIWALADGAWNTLFDGRGSPEHAKRTAKRWTESMPEAYLFQMLCSYGGAFAAVCSEIAVYQLTAPE
jgi:hypothetical protein